MFETRPKYVSTDGPAMICTRVANTIHATGATRQVRLLPIIVHTVRTHTCTHKLAHMHVQTCP